MGSYEHICTCGKTWKVTKRRIAQRDRDSEECTCGEAIVSWNGGVYYLVEEIKGE